MSTVIIPDFSNLTQGTGPENANQQGSETVAPNFKGITIDRDDPESMGAEPAFSSVYMPNFYKGFLDAATFLVDVPTTLFGKALGAGAELLGLEESAKDSETPLQLVRLLKKALSFHKN